MGREARCVGHFSGQSGEGKLLLETNELIFRGPFRLVAPIKGMKAEAKDGALHVRFKDGAAHFDLGKPAETWAKAIREPKGLIQKLGIKPGQRMAIVGAVDPAFVQTARDAGAELALDGLDHLFFQVATEADLKRMDRLKRLLAPAGALWILRPKGPDGVSELATRAVSKKAGLVDVKIAAFSATHTAEKFVIPVAKR